MRRYLPLLIMLAALSLFSCAKKEVSAAAGVTPSAEESKLKTFEKPTELADQYAYVYGYQLASQFLANYPDSDADYVLKGIFDALYGDSYFTSAESSQILIDFHVQLQEKVVDNIRVQDAQNKAAAEAFLSTNRHRSAVVDYSDQLQYEVLREGNENGAVPLEDSVVTVDYQLMTLDGDVHDSSYVRGYPSVIALPTAIEGFRTVLMQMKEGEKVRAGVHPALGYGFFGSGTIGPGELLIFDIELISVGEQGQ